MNARNLIVVTPTGQTIRARNDAALLMSHAKSRGELICNVAVLAESALQRYTRDSQESGRAECECRMHGGTD